MTTILSTGKCFDDAMHFLEDLGVEHLLRHGHEYTLVHAACAFDGRLFAHAWVERVRLDRPTLIWQAGILDGRRIVYATRKSEFPALIRKEWRYTLREAVDANYRTGHFGPWVPMLDALCADGEPQQVSGALDIEVVAVAGGEGEAIDDVI